MKVVVDTNVILDHVLDRKMFAKPAGIIFSLIEQGRLSGALCATTVTTIFYLAAKVHNAKVAREVTGDLLRLFEVAPVNRCVLDSACSTKFTDLKTQLCMSLPLVLVHRQLLHEIVKVLRSLISPFTRQKKCYG